MRALRWLAAVAVLGALAVAAGVGLVRRLHRLHQREARSFVSLAPDQPVRFVVRDTPWVELVTRDGQGPLAARWLLEGAPEGPPLSLAVAGTARTLRLAVPKSASGLELIAGEPLAVRVRIATPAGHSGALRRLAFLASERSELAFGWKTVPPDGNPEVRRLPQAVEPPRPRPPAPTRAALSVSAGQTRPWVVKGPGTLILHWQGAAPAEVTLTGASVRREAVSPGTTTLSLPDGASLVEVRAAQAGQLELETSSGQAPVSAERSQRVSLLVPGQKLRFRLEAAEGAALRLSGWLLHPAAEGGHLKWRLGGLLGERPLAGAASRTSCKASPAACEPVGEREELFLAVAPQAQAELELSSDAAALVSVDAQLERGADPRPRPPFDEPPAGFQWEGAPPRASRWVFLRPADEASSLTLTHAATLVASTPPPPRATMSMAPEGARRSTVVLEPGEGRSTAFVPISAGSEREVVVDGTGARARRLGLSCVSSDIGGSVSLVVDGASAGQRTFSSNDLLLETAAAPGPHRVKLLAPASARCHLMARAAGGGWRKHTVYPVDEVGLEWALPTSSAKKTRVVSFAVYGDARALGPSSAVRVAIDGGRVKRVAGASEQITVAVREVPLGGRPPLEVRTLSGTRAFDRLGVVRVVLGDDLAVGPHRISVKGLDAGALFLRAWTDGHRAKPERAEGWITTEDTP